MQKRKFKILVIIALIPMFSFAQEDTTSVVKKSQTITVDSVINAKADVDKTHNIISIKSAVDSAMRNNHTIIIARNNIKIAENNAGLMNSGFLPTLSANGGLSKKNEDTYSESSTGAINDVDGNMTDSYNYGIALNYRLFDGMGRFYNYKKFQSSFTLEELKSRSIIENTLMNLIVAYYDVAKLTSKLENQRRTMEISNERHKLVSSKFEFGQAGKLDVLRSEVDMNNDSINFINTMRDLKVARRNFNVILSRDVRTEFEVDTIVSFSKDIDEEKMMQLALAQNVDYLLSLQNVDIAMLNKKASSSGYIPKVDLTGGYSGSNIESEAGFFPKNERHGYNLGASLSWNLFDGGRTSVQMQNAKIAELNAKEQSFDQKNNLEREISNAYVVYENSLYVMKAEQKNMQTNQLNFNYSKEKYSLGQISSIDYRKAQVDLESSVNRYNEAKYLAKVAELKLIKLAGLFMQEIRL
jgi:outer membrane protein TolC